VLNRNQLIYNRTKGTSYKHPNIWCHANACHFFICIGVYALGQYLREKMKLQWGSGFPRIIRGNDKCATEKKRLTERFFLQHWLGIDKFSCFRYKNSLWKESI